jgi:hypothetical protein
MYDMLRHATHNIQHLAEQECDMVCHAAYEPVCGSDGQTYPSACMLKLSACSADDASLFVAHEGECTAEPTEEHGGYVGPGPPSKGPVLVQQGPRCSKYRWYMLAMFGASSDHATMLPPHHGCRRFDP